MPSSFRSGLYCALFCTAALGLCVLTALKAPDQSIWTVHVWNEPSPPSAGRLPSYYYEGEAAEQQIITEIAGIAGSYVLSVILVCVILLTIGRRLRRATQASPGTLAMEILQPAEPAKSSGPSPWGPSPVSPTKPNPQWPSPQLPKSPRVASSKHGAHESIQSIATFDESVISEDRAKNEIEMDRLWGAVAEHESQRGQRSYPQSLASSGPRSPQAQNPPELQHLRNTQAPPMPQEPVSPVRTRRTDETIQGPSRDANKSPRRLHKPSPVSTSSAAPSRTSSRSSYTSWGRKKSPSIRDLPISPPMGSPDFRPDTRRPYDEFAPLSPRSPQHPPASAPPYRETFGSVEIDNTGRRFHFAPSIRSSRSSHAGSPAQTPRTATFPVAPPPAIREQPSREEAWAQLQHQQQPRREPFSFTVDAASERSDSPSISGKSTRSNKPKPLALDGSSGGSTSNLKNSLPFRALRSPFTQRPPSMIKSTEVERPDNSRFLQTPRTGVPPTPYSPYMPQTPLTPMTPSRLVTRQERKRAKKEEGRRVLTAADAVPEEDDLFGDAY